MTVQTEARNVQLEELIAVLNEQQAQKQDVVLRMNELRSVDGKIIVPGPYQFWNGVDFSNHLTLDPSDIFDEGLCNKSVPKVARKYLRDHRAVAMNERATSGDKWTDYLDHLFNVHAETSSKRVMVRAFVDPVTGEGTARCLVSDRFRAIDNLQILEGLAEGVKQAGAEVQVHGCDLSERRMRIKLFAPGIEAMAPILLNGYRSPFERPDGTGHGQEGLRDEHGNLPVVNAGLILGNGETGGAAFTVQPWVRVPICTNGMQLDVKGQGMNKYHTGRKLEAGAIDWADDTRRTYLDLIVKEVRDTVSAFLDPEWVQAQIDRLEEKAGTRLSSPAETIELVANRFGFSEAETKSVLDCFMSSGQPTTGGILNAVTAAAQGIENPDRANEFEAFGIPAMEMAFAAA